MAKPSKTPAPPWGGEAPEEGAESASVTVDESAESAPQGDYALVTVPKAYKLRLDDHTSREFKAGVQWMPREQAIHWYSVANGVAIFEQEKPE